MVFRTASHMVSPHQTRDLECFADSNKIPWNPPTTRCPDLIATIPQMSLLSLCALLFLQSHLFLICVALTYNDSRIDSSQDLPKSQGNVSKKWLLVSSSAPGTSLSSSGSPEKFLFCTGRIVTTVLPNLAPQWRIDDCFEIHILRWELCDLLLLNHQNLSALGTTVPARLLQESLVIFVSKQISQFGSFGKCV